MPSACASAGKMFTPCPYASSLLPLPTPTADLPFYPPDYSGQLHCQSIALYPDGQQKSPLLILLVMRYVTSLWWDHQRVPGNQFQITGYRQNHPPDSRFIAGQYRQTTAAAGHLSAEGTVAGIKEQITVRSRPDNRGAVRCHQAQTGPESGFADIPAAAVKMHHHFPVFYAAPSDNIGTKPTTSAMPADNGYAGQGNGSPQFCRFQLEVPRDAGARLSSVIGAVRE